MADNVVDLKKKLAELEAANAALRAAKQPKITLKVSEKGGVSVYGLGRFPVTLYKEQWAAVLDRSDAIREFIAANERLLKSKEAA